MEKLAIERKGCRMNKFEEILVGEVGFEPTNVGVRDRDLNRLATLQNLQDHCSFAYIKQKLFKISSDGLYFL